MNTPLNPPTPVINGSPLLKWFRANLKTPITALLIACFSLWSIQSGKAATFVWDITPGAVGAGDSAITGGSGTWNLANGNWTADLGVNNVLWGNTSVDDAIFGGTPGTITINTGTGITANKLTFNVDGYILNGNAAADVITLAGTTPTIGVTTSGHTATINAILAGAAGLTTNGAGTLALNGANTYTGITTISAGTVRLLNAAALGSSAAATDHTTVAAGATLDLNGLTIAESFGRGGATLPLDGFAGATAILTNSNAAVAAITGTINFDGGGAFTVNGTGNITLDRVARTNGTTGNPLITKDGANTLILAGTADNAALGVTVNAGVVQLNKGGTGVRALGSASTIGATGTLRLTTGQANGDQLFSQVDLTNNGTFDLQGQDESFNNMTGTGVVTNGATSDASVLTLGENNGVFTWGGVIQNGAGTSTLALTKVGTGTMTITNNNTYTGATQISGTGGGLTLNFSAVGGSNDNLISASSLLTMNNTSASRTQTLTLTGDTVANNQTFNGTSITGAGTRHQIIATSGAGGSLTLNLGALSITSGALVDFVLPTTGGINTTSANTILGPLVTVNNGGAYARIFGGQIAAFTGDLTYATTANIGALGGYTATGNLLVDSTSTGNVIQAAGTTDLSTLSITDTTARTLTIGAGNTLRLGAMGGILRSSAAGSVVVGDSGNAGTLTTGILAGADLVLTNGNATGTLTVNSIIANNAGGAVDVMANGAAAATTILAGANTYTGTTTVQAGALRVTNGAAFGTITGGVTLLDGAAVELSGGISIGDEALSILGTGVSANGALRNFSGTNTYGGLVTLAGTGEIQADTGTTLIFDRPGVATAVTTGSAITFEAAGTSVITFNDALVTTGSGNPTITKNGTGALNFNVANTFAGTGGFTISAGTVRISNGGALGGNTGGTSIGVNAALELTSGISTNEAITLNNTTGISTNGAIRNISGNNFISGQVTVDNGAGRIQSDAGVLTLSGGLRGDPDATTVRALTVSGTGNVHVTGNIVVGGGTGGHISLTKIGTGTLTLSGTNASTSTTSVTGGSLVVTNAAGLGSGAVTVNGGGLNYYAATDAPLVVAGTLGITGGASTVIGGSIGSTVTSAQINVTGAATITNAAHRVNIYGVLGTTPTTGTYTLIQGGASSSLNPTTAPTLGTVFNNTNFTVGAFTRSATALQVGITAATPITAAFWKGGLTGATNVWSASNGATQSNWVATSGGADQALVPGAGADLTISNSVVTSAPTATVLGGNMTIKTLTIADTTNGLGLNADGNTLIITPASAADGIIMAASVPASAIAANVALGAAQTWTNNSANGLTVSGVVSGAFALTKAGTGPMTLSGINTYSGGTTLSAGTLVAASTQALGLAANTLSLAGGTLDLQIDSSVPAHNTAVSGNATIVSNRATSNAGITHTLGTLSIGAFELDVTAGLNVASGTAGLTFGATTFTGAPAFDVGAGANLTLGAITNASNFATIKQGAGILTIAGANASTGTLAINAGTLTLNASGRWTGDVTVATGGTLQNTGAGTNGLVGNLTVQSGGVFDNQQTGAETIAAFNLEGTGISGTGAWVNNAAGTTAGTLTSTAGITLTGNASVGGAGNIATASAISGTGFSLTKVGAGTLTLGAAASTFDGGLIVRAGTVIGGNNANTFGATANPITLGDTSGSANAAIVFVNAASNGSNPISVVSGSSGTASITLGNSTGAIVLSGPITLAKDLILTKSGTTGASQITGGITGTGNVIISNNATTGTITLATAAINPTGSISNTSTASGATTISADIGSNVTNITQSSATSALTLSGASIAYTGATNVSAGILNISGDAASGARSRTTLSVAGGATLNTLNAAGQVITLSGAINLGAGAGTTTLGLDIGSLANFDQFASTAAATTANSVVLNLNGIGGIVAGNYDLLTASSGLNTASYSIGSFAGGGGFRYSLVSDPTYVRLTAAAQTGAIYWGGSVNNSWSAYSGTSTNFANDLAGTNANGTPGVNSNVIFSTSTQTAASLATTLDGAFSIRDLTFNNQIGSGPLTSIGIAPGVGGSLTLTPTLASAGINIETGAPASIAISAPITLSANQTWTVADIGTNLTSSGIISGTANLVKAGPGTLTISGAHTYVGTTTVSAGVFQAGATNGFNTTSAHIVDAGTTLRLNNFAATVGSLAGAGTVDNLNGTAGRALTAGGNNASTTFSGVLQNGGSFGLGLAKVGTGMMTLTGNNTMTGNYTVNGGRLAVTTGTTTNGAGQFTVGSGATTRGMLLIGTGANITTTDMDFGSNATNAAGAGYQTAGTVTLTAADANGVFGLGNASTGYGYYEISGGIVNMNRLTLSNTGTTGTGIFRQTGGTVNIGTWTTVGHGSGSALLDIEGGTYNSGANFAMGVNDAGAFSVTNVRGTGTLVAANGSTLLTNRGDNAARDNMTNVLNVLTGGTIRTASGGITNGTTTGATNNFVHINLNGGTIITNQATTSLININNTNSTLTANSGAFIYSGGLTVDTNGLNSTIPSPLQAPSGQGVQSIAVSTEGTGYIGAPIVRITGGTGAGATAVANMVDDGSGNGTYKVGSITITNPGTGYLNTDVLTVSFVDNASVYTTQASLGAVSFNGGNTSGGLTKTGAGILTLSGTNTYTGGTTISAGTVALGVANALADTGNVTIAGGTFDVATFNDTVATVSLQSGSITGTTGTLTSNAAYDMRSGSASAILAGSMGLNKTTAGTVTLSGANTYSGVTNITAGTLAFSAANNLGNASGTITLNGGTLNYTGSTSINLAVAKVVTIGSSGGTLNAADAGGTLNLLGGITAATAANLTKTGLGTVSVTGSTNLNGGNVTVSAGVLNAGFTSTGLGAIDVANGATLNLYDAATTTVAINGLTLATGSSLGFDLNAPTVNDILNLTGTANVIPTVSLNFNNLGGLGVGTYDLINVSAGTLTATDYVLGIAPSGLNYNFSTINSNQTLRLTTSTLNLVYWHGDETPGGSSWSTLNGAGPFSTNWATTSTGTTDLGALPASTDTLVFSNTNATGPAITTTLDGNFTADSLQFTDNPSGVTSVAVNQGTSGTLTLTPASANNGIAVATNAGAISIGAPVATGAVQTWEVIGGGTNGSSLTVSGAVAVNHLINKTGAGTLTLSGSNSGAGGINLASGSLIIGHSNALGTGPFTIGAATTINTGASAIANAGNNVQNWDGNFTFTGTNQLNLGTGAVTMGDNVIATVAAQTLTVGGAIGDGVSTFGLTKVGAGTLTLSGANTYGGLTNLSIGTLNLNGNNSGAAGGVTMAGSTNLNLGHANALGSGTFTINGGTLNNTSGSSMTLGSNVAQTWNSGYTFTGTHSLNMGTGAVTLGATTQIATTANTLTVNGVIDDGANTFGITKVGAGTLSLGGLNTYGGATTIDVGTLELKANQNLAAVTNTLVFGSSNTTATTGTLDLSTASATFGGTMTVQTNSSSANTITIGNSQFLTVNGNVTIGSSATSSTTTSLAVSGLGAFNVTNTAAAGAFTVGGSNGTGGAGNIAVADFSGLATMNVNLSGTGSAITVNPNLTAGTTNVNNLDATLRLAATSTLTATTLTVGGGPTNNGSAGQRNELYLGSTSTTLKADTINVGNGSRDAGFIGGGGGTLTITDKAGTGRAALNIGTGAAATGAIASGGNVVDLTNVNASLSLSTLTIGGQNRNTDRSDILNFVLGTLDATTVVVGDNGGTASTTVANNTWTSTLNIGGGTTTIGTGGLEIGRADTAVTGTDVANGIVNITAGTVTIANSAGLASAVRLGNNTIAAGITANGSLNITGGNVTVSGHIIKGATTGAGSATLTLNGGSLNMSGNNIGAATPTVTFNAQSGTLQNVAQINGGAGLTKTAGAGTNTLILEGTNTYTGNTVVSSGTLQLGSGSASGSMATTSPISLGAGATFAVKQSDLVTQGIEFSSAAITGLGGFAQSGTGTTLLNVNNTYSGPTSVSDGNLQVGVAGVGGITGTISVTVMKTGATYANAPILSGSGTIGGATVIGESGNPANKGILAPGDNGFATNRTLTLAPASSLTVHAGSQVQMGITAPTGFDAGFASYNGNAISYLTSLSSTNDGTFGSAPAAWFAAPSSNQVDHLALGGGSLTLGTNNGGAIAGQGIMSIFSNSLVTGSLTRGQIFNLIDWTGLLSGSFNVGSGFSTGGIHGDFDLPDISSTNFAWDTSAFRTHGVIVVVPEPSRLLLLFVGLFGLFFRRRQND